VLPKYIANCSPNDRAKRSPWYSNIAPAYAGVWLWVVFYQQIAHGTLREAGLLGSLLTLVTAAISCHFLFYYAPGMMGMKSGYPLFVVGSSTFGATGGVAVPGLLMGLLQIGWVAVSTAVAANFLLQGLNMDPNPGKTPLGNLPFTAIAIVWGVTVMFVGVKGIGYVSRVSSYINIVAFLMIALVFFKTRPGLSYGSFTAGTSPFLGITTMVQIVMGFFATAGAAGADFGMNSRHALDIKWGGIMGIVVAATYAGALPLLSVAGAQGLHPNFSGSNYSDVISLTGGGLARIMFFLFAAASVVPGCVSSFIASNSFSTMAPKLPRSLTTLPAAAASILLAVTGLAGNLVNVFLIVGASFGPICGAMTADYLLSGRKWAGPRRGINFAGYIAWAAGFVVGIIPFLPLSQTAKNYTQPQVLYSWITGFVIYALAAKAGLQPAPEAIGNADEKTRLASA